MKTVLLHSWCNFREATKLRYFGYLMYLFIKKKFSKTTLVCPHGIYSLMQRKTSNSIQLKSSVNSHKQKNDVGPTLYHTNKKKIPKS